MSRLFLSIFTAVITTIIGIFTGRAMKRYDLEEEVSRSEKGDHFKWWRGSIRKSYTEEYYQDDERMYFKSEDIDELIEDYSDNIWVDDNDISTEDLEKEAEKRVKDIPWKKAIFVKISLP